ncbi:MAG: TonB family protein, partial [Planctomycetes bacterium]|nr:TonB family protein [Planctomycetota bacterium]
PGLLADLVATLDGRPCADAERLWRLHRGDLRACLRALYDRYARGDEAGTPGAAEPSGSAPPTVLPRTPRSALARPALRPGRMTLPHPTGSAWLVSLCLHGVACLAASCMVAGSLDESGADAAPWVVIPMAPMGSERWQPTEVASADAEKPSVDALVEEPVPAASDDPAPQGDPFSAAPLDQPPVAELVEVASAAPGDAQGEASGTTVPAQTIDDLAPTVAESPALPAAEVAGVLGSDLAVDAAPAVVNAPDLRRFFPRVARQRGIEGESLLQLRIDAQGAVSECIVLRSQPPGVFDQAAIACAKSLSFHPAQAHGHPVATVLRLPIRWRLRD